MKDFFKRNAPVFIIGLITLGIFLLIIIVAQKNTPAGPVLKKISGEEFFSETTPTKGNPQAKVTLVEFSDFECPACKAVQPAINKLVDKYSDYVYFAFKNFPLPQHTQAKEAAIAALAAAKQGKFWEYADKLFENQPNFSSDNLVLYAADLQLDVNKFRADLADASVAQAVGDDLAQAERIGLNGTPSFILDGQPVDFAGADGLEQQLLAEFKKNNVDVVAPETSQSSQEAQATPTGTQDTRTGDQVAFDKKYGFVQIDYTYSGFRPENTNAIVGQVVRFRNTTKEDMQLKQVIALYDQLKDPVTIKAGQTYDVRMTQEKLWTFKEASRMHYGSVFSKSL